MRKPECRKLALELRNYAGNLRDHEAKQLFLKMAAEYERLAGKAATRKKYPNRSQNA